MSEFVHDCPRCGALRVTFSALGENPVGQRGFYKFELFGSCRVCGDSSVFLVQLRNESTLARHLTSTGLVKFDGQISEAIKIIEVVRPKKLAAQGSPPHVPTEIANAFREGAISVVGDCPNAAGTMFRLCLDMATVSLLPADATLPPPHKVRRDLGLRLPWLFETGKLPQELSELSSCIKEDGNDGAHRGTLKMIDAEDILDFTHALLDKLYSEPERLRLAMVKRAERRAIEAKK